MQGQMNKPEEFVLLSIPAELIEEAGLSEGDILQMYVDDGSLIIESVYEFDEDICCDDCRYCPANNKGKRRG